MKKRIMAAILAAIVMAVSGTVMHARKANDRESAVIGIIEKYGDKEGVESVNMGRFLLGLAKMAAGNDDEGDSAWLKYVDRITIVSAEQAEEDVRDSMSAELTSILSGYEKAAEMNNDDDDMSVWVKMEGDSTILEMIMFSGSEYALIYIGGRIPVSEMENMASDMQ